ncbi:MAG: hypothetical protein KIT31_19335, partial [Deltaproteobacteria bacterium]|nr:hypothetical protein [Deltaproteobacteria bacterium]
MQSKPPSFLALVALVVLVACGGAPVAVGPGRDGDFAARIDDAATWTALAARAGNDTLARVEVVKVLLDRDDDRLYFTQSRRWPLHFAFASRFLGRAWDRVIDQRRFNEREYHAPDRRFVLGSVTRYLDQDRWTFELAASDTLALDATAKVFARIRGAVYFGAALHYRPIPATHQGELAAARALMPVLTTDELWAGVVYQPLEIGDAVGILRIVPAGAPVPADLRPYEVVVLGTQPLELPPVAGIITDEVQAPLGHIAILAHTRRTPNMARRGASTLPQIAALAGKPVRLVVGATDYRLEAVTQEELAKAAANRRGVAPKLVLDLRDAGLPALADIRPRDAAR